VQGGLRESLPAALLARLGRPSLVSPASLIQFADNRQKALVLQIQGEDLPHARRFVLVDHQPQAPGINIVTQDWLAAGPLPLAPGRRDLVAGAFRDDLALELREAEENVQSQPAHRVGGVELLAHRGDILGPPGDYTTAPTTITGFGELASVPYDYLLGLPVDYWKTDTEEITISAKQDGSADLMLWTVRKSPQGTLDNLLWRAKRQRHRWFPE
jgi:hypothetical protein